MVQGYNPSLKLYSSAARMCILSIFHSVASSRTARQPDVAIPSSTLQTGAQLLTVAALSNH